MTTADTDATVTLEPAGAGEAELWEAATKAADKASALLHVFAPTRLSLSLMSRDELVAFNNLNNALPALKKALDRVAGANIARSIRAMKGKPSTIIEAIAQHLDGMADGAWDHGYVNAESYHAAYEQGVREAAAAVRALAPQPVERIADGGETATYRFKRFVRGREMAEGAEAVATSDAEALAVVTARYGSRRDTTFKLDWTDAALSPALPVGDRVSEAEVEAAQEMATSCGASISRFTLRAALQAARRVSPTWRGEWQPIETAPKDGATVDLWGARNGVEQRFTNARWLEIHGWGTGEPTGHFRWYFDQHDIHGEFTFLRWMPLPVPPALGEKVNG